MSAYCVDCGSPLPDDQGSRTCSMCYGDPGHGRDGYYQRWLDDQREEEEREAEAERQREEDAYYAGLEERYWREQEEAYEESHG